MSMPQSSANVPKLRFPGFAGEWRDCALGEVASVKHGLAFDGEHFSSEGDFIVLTPGNFTADGAFRYQGAKEKFYTSNDFPREYVLSRGDFLMVMTEQAVGLIGCTLLVPEDGRLLHNQRLGLIQIHGTADAEYLHRYFKTERMRVALSKTGAGTKVRHTSPKRIEGLQINIPSLPEQQKIAGFLTAVDGRIEQLSRKKALLETYKKGVMQQLFTQTLRFQDDHGHDFPDWEEKTLGSICSTFKSGSGITAEEIHESGSYPVYGGNGLRGYTDQYTHDGEFVLIGRQGALCGNINRASGKSYISEHAIAVAGNSRTSTDWLAHRLDHLKLNRLSESSAQPGLAVNKLEKLKLHVPSLPEQKKIAGFLSALDGKIAAVEEQRNRTQAWKKGLLQQMFV